MIEAHLPVLQVVAPLMAAPLCVVAGRGRIPWLLTVAVSWISLAISIALLGQVMEGQAVAAGSLSYALGGWPAPWGIEYRVDAASALALVVVSGVSAVVAPYSLATIETEVRADRLHLFYASWLLCLAGLLGIASTGDAFNLFVFLEISSLSSYVLIALGRDRRAPAAAFRYLVMGTVGATFILIGVAFLYMMTGTLNMADLSQRLPGVDHTRTVKAGFAFLTVGIAIKMALFPLHAWLPGAYTHAPSAVTAFLAGTATKVAVYVWLRFFFSMFGNRFSFGDMQLDWLLGPLALAGVLATAVIAIYQRDVKRMLAFSSIGQVGYMALGIGFASAAGVTAALVHLFNHALMKTTLFMALGALALRAGGTRIDTLAGAARTMPWTAAAFAVGGLSLVGIPLTAGFVSKWYLVAAALEQGRWLVAGVVVLSSLLALVYVGRVLEAVYLREPSAQAAAAGEAPAGVLAAIWVMAGANLYFGVWTDLPVGAAGLAGSVLAAPPEGPR